jgi:hypothetical protein
VQQGVAVEMSLRPRLTFDYVDVTRISKKLLCCIVKEPAVEPRVHNACKNLFSEHNISKWLQSHNTCPMCQAACTMDDFQPSPSLPGLLDELEVYCPNKERGCQWKGERGSLAEHLERFCELSACVNEPKGCKWRGSLLKLAPHLEGHCEYVQVYCPEECGVKVERSALKHHLEKDCAITKRKEEERKRLADKVAEEERIRVEQLAAAEVRRQQEKRAVELESMCDTLNPAAEDAIRLNVGGTFFETTRGTLTKYPLSVLGVMFSETRRKLKRDATGAVFLDADPFAFRLLLAWLREGVRPGGLSRFEQDEVLRLAQKFHLVELSSLLVLQAGSGASGFQLRACSHAAGSQLEPETSWC